MVTIVANGASVFDHVVSDASSPATGERIQREGRIHDARVSSPAELLAKLPPSGRDFDVFEHVVVGGGTTRGVAHEFQISQTRICQVLERVRDWIDEIAPGAGDKQVSSKQLQLAVGLAADRLDHLYSQAMTGWRSSEGEAERIHITGYSQRVTTRTTSHGDTRYLAVAARIALLRSKLASLGVTTQALAAAADIIDGPLPDEVLTTEPSDHPDEACSENAECKARNAELEEKKPASNRAAAKSSDPLRREQAAARRAFFGPVQNEESNARSPSRDRKKESVVAGVPK